MSLSVLLKKELTERKKAISAYSMRSFARDLDISVAQLSQLISEKRNITDKTLHKIIKKLQLTNAEIKKIKNHKLGTASITKELNEDHFRLISDWYHFAILSLSEIKETSSDPRFVSKRLKISAEEANEALFRLKRLGLIEIAEDGTYKQKTAKLNIESKTRNESIQKFHLQMLKLAEFKLKTVQPSEREFSAITMAINPDKLDKARELIKEFKEDLSELLETGEKKEVYQLSIQLFPLT